jgi:hypothetical protein
MQTKGLGETMQDSLLTRRELADRWKVSIETIKRRGAGKSVAPAEIRRKDYPLPPERRCANRAGGRCFGTGCLARAFIQEALERSGSDWLGGVSSAFPGLKSLQFCR